MSVPVRFAWFDLLRQLVMFVTGLGLIVYGVIRRGSDLTAVITGFVLVGIAPVDRYVGMELVR